MIKATVKINLYEFSELSETAKRKAIDDEMEFLVNVVNENFVRGDYYEDYAEFEKDLADVCRDDVAIDSIEMNKYLFYENGEMASVGDDEISIQQNSFEVIWED